MNEDTVKKLALIISANCIKESVIEQCHTNNKISDKELNAFNQQMSDKIYTFLTYLLNKPANEYTVMMEAMAKNYPTAWPLPNLDTSFLNQTKQTKAADNI
ncbi:hypothetical protein [Endozoicomonas sp. Mp262]|uniref:hypothetical protein n=1 Tax=Endozoicomonas sp. Mp262 TaxID=2919499 RepID=UPI0021DB2253